MMKDSDEMQEARSWTNEEPAGLIAMKNVTTATDTNVDYIKIRCIIERGTETLSELLDKRFLELDTVTKIPGSLPLQDLVEAVLIENSFDRMDILSARAVILPTKKWQPVALESVTSNAKATVQDVMKGIEESAILRIRIQKGNYCEQQLKDLLLKSFLSTFPDEVFQDHKCPLDKATLEGLCSGRVLSRLTEPMLDTFRDWLESQNGVGLLFHKPSTRCSNEEASTVHRTKPEDCSNSQSPKPAVSDLSRTLALSNQSSVALDYSTEIVQLEKWFRENWNPSLNDIIRYLDELNQQDYRQSNPSLTLNDITNWFINARMYTNLSDKIHFSCLGKFQPSIYSKTLPANGERKRRRLNSSSEFSVELKEPVVPPLPNKNAVYVVHPLPPEASDPESIEMVQPARAPSTASKFSSKDEHMNESETHVSQKTGMRSDENHNDCSSSLVDVSSDEATDLSLEKRCRASSATPWADCKPNTGNYPSSPWLLKKLEKDTREYEVLSGSPSPKRMADNMLHSSLPSSFIFPHYPVARISHVSSIHHNAIQMAAMSQLFHQSAAAFYNASPQPHFRAPSYEGEDNSSPGSNNGGDIERRKRSRVFIDPNTEIPRLEQWYNLETHPSALQIEQYTKELNNADYRQRFPKLETKNVQLWFKNHRAKVKRLQGDDDDRSEPFNGSNGFPGQ